MTRSLTALVALALVGGGLWWILTRPIELPQSAAATPAAQTAAPKIPPPPKAAEPPKVRVEMPTPAAQPPPQQAPAAAKEEKASVDAQLELSTAIPDVARRLRQGDWRALLEDYMPPDQLAAMPAEQRAQMEQMMDRPEAKQMLEMYASIFDSMKDQTPEMNAAGDEATYMVMPPMGAGGGNLQPFHFKKINGRWYVNER